MIEPNSSEEEEFKKSMMNLSWGKSGLEPQTQRSERFPASEQTSPAPSSRTSKTSESSGGGQRPISQSGGSIPVTSQSGGGSRPRPRSEASPTARSKNLLRSEPDLLSGVGGLGEDKTINSVDLDKLEGEDSIEFGEEFYSEDLQMLPYDLESDSSMQMKKKGFLKKLSISKWAGKKKSSKSSGKVKEIGPEYFRETYGIHRGANDTEVLLPSSSSRERLIETVSPSVENMRRGQRSISQSGESIPRNSQSGERLGVTTITVGQDPASEPVINRMSSKSHQDDRMTKSLSPSSRKSGASKVRAQYLEKRHNNI